MQRQKYLFCRDDLDAVLGMQKDKVASVVESIPKDEFTNTSDEVLVERVVACLSFSPLAIYTNKIVATQNETVIDVSGDPHWFDKCTRGKRVDIKIPFTGTPIIFYLRTDSMTNEYPEGEVKDGHVCFSIELGRGESPKYKYDNNMYYLEQHIGFANKQVNAHNARLPDLAKQAISFRRKQTVI